MKLGLVTDSLVDRSLAEAAAVCRGLGLEQVELGCGNWSPAPHVDLKGLTADAGARHRLLDTLGENGLTISALNCSGNPLFPGEKGAGDRAVAEGTFLLAEQLGVETVVMMSGLPGGCPEDRTPTWIVTSWPPETEEILRYQWKAAVPVWKALAARARDHGVKRIALEFHGWQLVYNVETLRRLRSEVGDDILGVNLDPSHLFWMGADPVEVARALADCIYHVHIKDVRLEPAAGQNTLLDTKGVLEFASRSWNFVTPAQATTPPGGAAFWRRCRTAATTAPSASNRRITPSRWRRPCRRPCPCCGRRCPPEIRKAPPHERGGAFFRTGSPQEIPVQGNGRRQQELHGQDHRHAHPKDPVERLVAEEVHPQQGTHAAAHHGQKQQIFLRHPLAEPGVFGQELVYAEDQKGHSVDEHQPGGQQPQGRADEGNDTVIVLCGQIECLFFHNGRLLKQHWTGREFPASPV